jgi:hypothetical protein
MVLLQLDGYWSTERRWEMTLWNRVQRVAPLMALG